MTRPAIAVYAIMKNEGKHVDRWAENVHDADVVIVVDTGSTDDTMDRLYANDIEASEASFDPFRFDDALNTALALVPPDIDVVMRLDADETVAPGWAQAIREVYEPGITRYYQRCVNHGSGWGEMVRPYIHARHGLRWKYPTHEVLTGPETRPVFVDAQVDHWPDETKSRSFNLRVLADAAAEDPNDLRMAFYLAREFFYVGDYPACRDEMGRFLAMPGGWDMERCEAWRILAAIDFDPERWLWRAVGEAPTRREPWVDLLRLAIKRGDRPMAAAMFTMAERCTDRGLYTTQQDCWDEGFESLRPWAG